MNNSKIERILEAHKALVAANAEMDKAREQRDVALRQIEIEASQLKTDLLTLGVDVALKEVARIAEEREAAVAQWESQPECIACGGKTATPSEVVLDASLIVKDMTSPCICGPEDKEKLLNAREAVRRQINKRRGSEYLSFDPMRNITKIGSIPRPEGARYLECVRPQEPYRSLIAKAWHIEVPATFEVLIEWF